MRRGYTGYGGTTTPAIALDAAAADTAGADAIYAAAVDTTAAASAAIYAAAVDTAATAASVNYAAAADTAAAVNAAETAAAATVVLAQAWGGTGDHYRPVKVCGLALLAFAVPVGFHNAFHVNLKKLESTQHRNLRFSNSYHLNVFHGPCT